MGPELALPHVHLQTEEERGFDVGQELAPPLGWQVILCEKQPTFQPP